VQQSIDISCPSGPQQQTHRTLLQRSIDGTDRQTDGRAVTQTLTHTLRAVSVTHISSSDLDATLSERFAVAAARDKLVARQTAVAEGRVARHQVYLGGTAVVHIAAFL